MWQYLTRIRPQIGQKNAPNKAYPTVTVKTALVTKAASQFTNAKPEVRHRDRIDLCIYQDALL